MKVKQDVPRRVPDHFDPPTQAGVAQQQRGWVGIDGTLAKHKFRFVTTHLEAYSPAIADKQMQQLLKSAARWRRRRSSRSSSATSTRRRARNANDRGTDARDNAYYSAIEAGFRNHAAEAQDVLLRRGPAQHRGPLETWIDHSLVRPKIKLAQVRASSARSRSAASTRPTTRASPPRCA